MIVEIPSPAIAVVGRHNSGKTTLVVKLIGEMAARGYDVGSIKHHSHGDFEIDYPGKDSYRHREAGTTETVIASPTKIARTRMIDRELECSEILQTMPGHDVVIVEGYRKSGLPTIEIMRSGNKADAAVAEEFAKRAESGIPLAEALSADDVQSSKARACEGKDALEATFRDAAGIPGEANRARDLAEKMPTSNTVAIVTDIPMAAHAAELLGIPCFGLEDTTGICDFLEERYTRTRITVVIQAGGESRRMGQSKALVDYQGRPLIERFVERLYPAADELVITTNEEDRLQFLNDGRADDPIRLCADEYDYRGALPGLCTALRAASNEFVAVIACDMIFASPRLVVAEAIEMSEAQCDIVVPVNQHGYEPFHAMYRRSTCLPAVERAIEAGHSRVQTIFDDAELNVVQFPQKRVLDAEPRGGCFINANTPEELAAIAASFPIV